MQLSPDESRRLASALLALEPTGANAAKVLNAAATVAGAKGAGISDLPVEVRLLMAGGERRHPWTGR